MYLEIKLKRLKIWSQNDDFEYDSNLVINYLGLKTWNFVQKNRAQKGCQSFEFILNFEIPVKLQNDLKFRKKTRKLEGPIFLFFSFSVIPDLLVLVFFRSGV